MKTNTKKKDILKQIAMTAISLAVLLYLVLQLTLSIGDVIDKTTAVYAVADEKLELTAYLFRDEKCISVTDSAGGLASASGTASYIKGDGEKVRLGDETVRLYAAERDAETQDKINAINRRIQILEQSAITKGASSFSSDYYDDIIEKLLIEKTAAIQSGSISKAEQLQEEIIIQSNKRQLAIQANKDESGEGNKLDYSEEISLLEEELSTLERTMSGAASTLYMAPSAGYYYKYADGYEGIFTAEALDNLTIKGFDAFKNAVPDTALKDSAVGKVALTHKWYIVCELDKRTASSLKKDESYSVIFTHSGNIELPMRLSGIISQTDLDTVLLVLECSSLPEGFAFLRMQTVELIVKTHEGLKVPVSALRVQDGEKGYFSLDGRKVIFKKTTVLYEQNGYYICSIPVDVLYPTRRNVAYVSHEYLSLYDTVINSGKDLYAGKVLS